MFLLIWVVIVGLFYSFMNWVCYSWMINEKGFESIFLRGWKNICVNFKFFFEFFYLVEVIVNLEKDNFIIRIWDFSFCWLGKSKGNVYDRI